MGDALLIAASGFLLGFLRGVAGLVLALVLYCLFYLAIAALHKIRRQERPPESYSCTQLRENLGGVKLP